MPGLAYLIIGVMIWFKVRVLQGLLYCDSFCWIKSQKFLEKVESFESIRKISISANLHLQYIT
jgi:hypothetical protein